ncbi:hypothetical protein N665_5618s0002 [Sinapis alba]|nr:hypothetical protein N665_5618s0002 [Sinapis alba]
MSWAGPEDIYLSTSLASYLDRKILVLLRDGRKLMGTLRSFDQFANAVLEGACERVIVGEQYCDIPLGLYVIRGENVVLIGDLDTEREELPPNMNRVSETEIKRAQKVEREASELRGTMRKRMEFLDYD